jgi:Fe-S-cluster containining protein
MYGASRKKSDIEASKERLESIYRQIPSTKGCMENINAQGGCGAWCCRHQNPQVLYSEFLNTWNYIIKNFNDDDFRNLFDRCLRKYLFPGKDNGCVLFNKDSNLCSQHETRPYNCRIYGITPDEEFKPRYERLKVLYPDTREQCNLVKTENGEPVTKQDINEWWIGVRSADILLGIKPELLNDGQTGCYRTYHDHLLVHILGVENMTMLTQIRLGSTDEEKEKTIESILSAVTAMISSLKGKKNEEAKPEGATASTPSQNS